MNTNKLQNGTRCNTNTGEKALGVDVGELFTANQVLTDVNSIDKSVIEKVSLIEQLDKKEKAAFFTMLDALITKKKLKDSLTNTLAMAHN